MRHLTVARTAASRGRHVFTKEGVLQGLALNFHAARRLGAWPGPPGDFISFALSPDMTGVTP